MSIIAVAAMAMTMTSCNKDEATKGADIYSTFENNEVMDQAKRYFIGHDQYWENGDRIYVMDGSYQGAYYAATTNETGTSLNLVWQENAYGQNFNAQNGVLTAFHPADLCYNRRADMVLLASHQTSVDGTMRDFPLYGKGAINEFVWYNLCCMVEVNVKNGNATIDSVSITTDKYINGNFKVNVNSANMLTYMGSSNNEVSAHGTKTNMLKITNPIVTTSEYQVARIYLPANTYNYIKITIYGNGGKYVKQINGATLARESVNRIYLDLAEVTFEPFINGAINAVYNVGTGNVVFSQGNLEYVAKGTGKFWQFADNQWDFRGSSQTAGLFTEYDRDLFAWGATGHYAQNSHKGNNYNIWPAGNNNYSYYNGTTLSGNNEWGTFKIYNGDNQINSGWRTLTVAEMNYLLENYEHRMVTLSFVGKTGMMIFPDDVTPISGTLTRAQWNACEAAGCVFFVADKYRIATGNIWTRIPTSATSSYYWLNTAADADNASALIVDQTEGEDVVTANKEIGAFIRLVKDVE